MSQNPQAQSGMITLMVVISLVMLASLTGFYSARIVLTDRLASNNQNQATQARLAAEAALAWARAELARQYATPASETLWTQGTRIPCPDGHSGAQWQCVLMSPPAHPGMPEANLQVLAVRDVVRSPHVVDLWASASWADPHSRGQVQASVFVPSVAPAPQEASTAAVVLNGCAAPAAGADVRVCPLGAGPSACSGQPIGDAVHSLRLPDLDGDGRMSDDERLGCLSFSPEHLPAGGLLTGLLSPLPDGPLANSASPAPPPSPNHAPVCSNAAWRSVLGDITPAQLKAWSSAQERQGLHDQSQPKRSIYWVDSPATWSQSLGSADSPVLLVLSAAACAQRCPSMAPGVRIWGTVVLQTQCQDHKAQAWRAGHIEGQLVVDSGLQALQSGSHIHARSFTKPAYQVHWPVGLDTSQVQRIAGSWREGVP
jgi:hypothetical protein